LRRPDVAAHVKIESFEDRVLVLRSIRKPKRIIAR
jgi:hypothetical protein